MKSKEQSWGRKIGFAAFAGLLLVVAIPVASAEPSLPREPKVDFIGFPGPCCVPLTVVQFYQYSLVAVSLGDGLLMAKDTTKLAFGVVQDLGWVGSYHRYQILSAVIVWHDGCT